MPYIISSGVTSGVTLEDGDVMYVSSGGTAVDTSVGSGGFLDVFISGVASNTVMTGGSLYLNGGTADYTLISGGSVSSGGGSAPVIRFFSGSAIVFNRGTANSVTIVEGGLTVSSGGTVNDTDMVGGSCHVSSGGKVNSAIVDGGILTIFSNGSVNGVSVNAGGRLTVSRGASAASVVENGGYVGVEDGAAVSFVSNTVSGLVLRDMATIHSMTTADGIAVKNGGCLFLHDGGRLTGNITFEDGAFVTVYDGAVVDFDLTRTSAGASALLNNLAPVAGASVFTLTVDGKQVSGEYKLADGAAGFAGNLTVVNPSGATLGTLAVGGTLSTGDADYTLNLSAGSLSLTVVSEYDPDMNHPDTGWNDYLYDKQKGWNSDENVSEFVLNEITGNCEIYLDVPGTIDFEGMHNMFGNDATNIDTGDVGKISVTTAAKLSFSVKSTADGTFYIYEDGVDKKGNRAQIQVAKVAVKKGKVAQLKDVCLTTTGKYYAAMTAKNVKKAGTQGVYNVLVVDSRLFVDADDGWNNIATNKAVVDNPVAVERGVKSVKLDNTAMIDGGGYQNFVGFSDGIDYAKLNLASTTYLSFDIGTNGNAKFTLWKRDTNSGKMTKVGGVVSLKSKNGELAAKSTKAQLLEVSDKYEYFISMESSDAAKGGSAYYNVNVNTVATRFFDSADGGENNWLYDKKSKTYNDDANLRTNTISGSGEKAIILDNNVIGDPAFNNFVGYQDAADYAKIVLTEKGLLSFQVTALADVSFEIWQKGEDKKGNAVLNSLQKKTEVKVKDYAVGASATTVALSLDAGEYYVSVTAKKATANEKGSALYNVTASFTSAVADAQLDSALAASGFASDDASGRISRGSWSMLA